MAHHHSPLPSPNSSSSTSTNNPSPTLTRSDPSNPYPTTFVQADTSSFKQVVQMLTGSSIPKPKPNHNHNHSPPINNKSKPSTKLYERRNNSFKHHLRPLNSHMKPSHDSNSNNSSPHGGLLLSPSMLDFPNLILSPVTPLIHDPFKLAEEKAIAEKGFFLHPVSPVSEPRLLPLFPLTSPKLSEQQSSLP